MPIPLLALAGGAVARTVGTRLVAGAAGRAAAGGATGAASGGGGGVAAGRALQFGGRALQMGATHRQQPHQPAPAPQYPTRVHKAADWAKNNPIEAAIGVTAAFSGNSLADSAANDFQQVVQPRQFSG